MTCNLGGSERAIRVAVGMGLIGGAFFVEQASWAMGGHVRDRRSGDAHGPDRFLPRLEDFRRQHLPDG